MDQYNRLELLANQIAPGSMLLRTWVLDGGISAYTTALEIQKSDGCITKMVVRQYGKRALEQTPDIASVEYRLLEILGSTRVVAPSPIYVDESGQILPGPFLVIEYIEGESDFSPIPLDAELAQMVDQLVSIHAIDHSFADLSFLPRQTERYRRMLVQSPESAAESPLAERVQDVLRSSWPLRQRNNPVLLHGDFWRGNILWLDDRIAAVIDWEDAATGDPLSDLAMIRLEILWTYGVDAMTEFTDRYRDATALDFTDLPLRDLFAALHPALTLSTWGLTPEIEARMRECLGQFTDDALGKLSAP